MNKRDFLKTTGFGLAGLIMSRRSAWADETVPPSPKPNIVFILSDDVGLSELSCCGGDHFKTPLDRLHLREKTLILFAGDNGTARFGASTSTLGGRPIFGMKASMKEGGSRVPLLVSWPGTTPAGKVNRDLTDFSDFFPTFAQLGQAPLPSNVALDGQSFAAQIRGEKGSPREWVYVELNGKSYARNARYKLTNGGELFDLRDAPFNEIPVPADTTDAEAIAARKRLQEVLSQHPAAPGVDREEKPARKNKPAKQKRKGAV